MRVGAPLGMLALAAITSGNRGSYPHHWGILRGGSVPSSSSSNSSSSSSSASEAATASSSSSSSSSSSADDTSKIRADSDPSPPSPDNNTGNPILKPKDEKKIKQINDLLSKHASSSQKLLSHVAPRIPAITRSPDFFLRIRSACDLDGYLASGVIKALAESYSVPGKNSTDNSPEADPRLCDAPARSDARCNPVEAGPSRSFRDQLCDPAVLYPLKNSNRKSEIIEDRRFVQLVECLLCVVEEDLEESSSGSREEDKKDKKEAHHHDQAGEANGVRFGIRSCSNAAWALAALGAHNSEEKLGGVSPRHLIAALSRKCEGELKTNPSIEDDYEAVVDAMWSFGYVYVATGIRSDRLMEACCLLLDDKAVESLSPSYCTCLLWSLAISGASDKSAMGVADLVKKRIIKVLKKEASPHEQEESPKMSGVDASPDEDIEKTAEKAIDMALSGDLEKVGAGTRVKVDAATVMSKAKEVEGEANDKDDNEVAVDKVMKVDAATFENNPNDELLREFSCLPQDLSTIVWSLAMMNRQSANLLDLVAKQLHASGPSTFQSLRPSHLANLAYAIAKGGVGKNVSSRRLSKRLEKEEYRFVLKEIARWSLTRLGVAPDDVPVECRSQHDGPDSFVPTDLSRLMWAIAFCDGRHSYAKSEGRNRPDENLAPLAQTAVEVAGRRLGRFSSEDLARITWAYGKLGEVSKSKHISYTYSTIGRIYSSIESTLAKWEDAQTREASDSAEMLPLHDVPMDTGLLSKSTWSFVKMILVEGPHSSGGWDGGDGGEGLVRIAAKIFCMNKAELLKQLSVRDVVRLTWSCAKVLENSPTQPVTDKIFSKLSAHIVAVLNEVVGVEDEDDSSSEGNNSTATTRLDKMLPCDVANVIWALSELGIGGKELTASLNLALSDLEEMTPAGCSMLLQGIVRMSLGSDDLVMLVLVGIEGKIGSMALEDVKRSVFALSGALRKLRGDGGGEELEKKCEEVALKLADKIKEGCGNLSAADMRAVLYCYVVMRVKVDDMVDAVDSEVTKRLGTLAAANNKMKGSFGSTIRTMINGVSEVLNKEDEEGEQVTSEQVKKCGQMIREVAMRLDRVGRGYNLNVDEMLENLEDTASFELGRCKQIVESYRVEGVWGDGEEERHKEGKKVLEQQLEKQS